MSNELEAFIEYITISKSLSKNSIAAYESDLVAIENTTSKSLIELKSDDVLKVLSVVENRRTINRKLSTINAFFTFCHKQRFVDSFSKFKLSKLPAVLPKYLSYSDVMSGLKAIELKKWTDLRDYALIIFLYATGSRISECLSVQREDFEDTWLRIRHGKGEKERYVPVASEALKAVENYLEASPYDKPTLWLNSRGNKLSRISAYKITQKYLNVSPHVLRHSYATALITGGADLRVVQELLGHSSLLTTQIYTHLQQSHLRETVNACHPLSQESL
ncbi:MAG: tyrosine-type recombinase/integrase [Campylobacterota bacterium]|nr:tyrosine-type recombinase/integrase [Campylobacterota bacterium]